VCIWPFQTDGQKLTIGLAMRRFHHWLNPVTFSVALALIAGGFIVRAHLPAVPLADGDTWGYLNPALSWLSGSGFKETNERDWFYPALLAAILRISGQFNAIVYVQRFLGLSGVLLFWLSWRSWLRFLAAPSFGFHVVSSIVALSLLSLYALSPQQALFENSIRPEGMLAFFEMMYFYCLLEFLRARWKLHQASLAILFGAGTLGLSYLVLLLKPSWGFSFGSTLLCLLAGALGKASLLVRFGPLLSSCAACLLVFAAPRGLGFEKQEARLFLPCTLVAVHTPQILETGAMLRSRDESSDALLPENFYQLLGDAYQPARADAARCPVLGFNQEYILYDSGFFSSIAQKENWTDRQLQAACYAAYFRAWRHVPISMMQKIIKQALVFLFPSSNDFYFTGKSTHFDSELANSRSFLPSANFSPRVQEMYQSYIDSLERHHANPTPLLGFRVLAAFAQVVAWLSFWLQAAFFLTLIIWSPRKKSPVHLAGIATVAVLAATYGNVLTVAVVHTLDLPRYRFSYAPGWLLGLAMTGSFLLLLALEKRRKPRAEDMAST
jgi:hypothetical protein